MARSWAVVATPRHPGRHTDRTRGGGRAAGRSGVARLPNCLRIHAISVLSCGDIGLPLDANPRRNRCSGGSPDLTFGIDERLHSSVERFLVLAASHARCFLGRGVDCLVDRGVDQLGQSPV